MTEERTRVAVLGTLAEFHREPIPYNLSALLDLVEAINPDFLCLDMTAEQWQRQNFSDLPPEYQETLLPLAHQTDIVIVPIGDGQSLPKLEARGWRGKTIDWLRRRIAAIQRTAPGPDAMNQGWRHDLTNHLYSAMRQLLRNGDKVSTHERSEHLTQSVLSVARRDPGTRILVVVHIQYCHLIRARLRDYDDVKVTGHNDL